MRSAPAFYLLRVMVLYVYVPNLKYWRWKPDCDGESLILTVDFWIPCGKGKL
jgi:hypothetical protein